MNIGDREITFMKRAVQLATEGMESGKGGPFGAVVVKGNNIVGEGFNKVLEDNDPTAHAEVVAIRKACKQLDSFQLSDCEIYCSCEPCPMCLGAIYWARPLRVYFANTREDAAAVDFDDAYIYEEISQPYTKRQIPFIHLPLTSAKAPFELWKEKADKVKY